MPRRRRRSSNKQLTTTIEPATSGGDDVDMSEAGHGEAELQTLVEPPPPEPTWKKNVRGIVYFDDYDGMLDDEGEEVVVIEIPDCSIDQEATSVYQCIKCGRKLNATPTGDLLFRLKCTRCFGKAFNKIRPAKWTKFNAV